MNITRINLKLSLMSLKQNMNRAAGEGKSSQKPNLQIKQQDPDSRPLRSFNEGGAWIEPHGEGQRTKTGQERGAEWEHSNKPQKFLANTSEIREYHSKITM